MYGQGTKLQNNETVQFSHHTVRQHPPAAPMAFSRQDDQGWRMRGRKFEGESFGTRVYGRDSDRARV